MRKQPARFSKYFIKTTSFALLITFVLGDFSHAAAGTVALNEFFPNPNSIQISSSIAKVHENFTGDSQKFIIHIQDAHTNLSAQKNLSKALEELVTKYGVDTVFVEAGTQDDSLTFLRDLASKETRERVAKKYLMKSQLNGAEYLSLSSDLDFKLIGVEDPALYRKGLQDYSRIVEKREKILSYLDEIQKQADSLKRRVYPKEMVEFDDFLKSYRKKGKDFTEYYSYLTSAAQKRGINLLGFPNFISLRDLKAKEEKIDFRKANQEQAKLIGEIYSTEEERNNFLQKTSEHFGKLRSESTSPLSFYDEMLKRSYEKKIDAGQYPNLLLYIDYLKTYSSIQMERLIGETDVLEEIIYQKSLPKQEQYYLYQISDYLRTLYALFSLQMSKEQFERYSRRQTDVRFETIVFLAFLNRQTYDLGNYSDIVRYLPILEDNKPFVEDFYRTTEKRDEVFVQKSLEIMDQKKIQRAVLLTGGYHTSNLKKLLKAKQVSYTVVAPVVSEETNTARYEQILLGQMDKGLKAAGIADKNHQGWVADAGLPNAQLISPAALSLELKEKTASLEDRLSGSSSVGAPGAGRAGGEPITLPFTPKTPTQAPSKPKGPVVPVALPFQPRNPLAAESDSRQIAAARLANGTPLTQQQLTRLLDQKFKLETILSPEKSTSQPLKPSSYVLNASTLDRVSRDEVFRDNQDILDALDIVTYNFVSLRNQSFERPDGTSEEDRQSAYTSYLNRMRLTYFLLEKLKTARPDALMGDVFRESTFEGEATTLFNTFYDIVIENGFAETLLFGARLATTDEVRNLMGTDPSSGRVLVAVNGPAAETNALLTHFFNSGRTEIAAMPGIETSRAYFPLEKHSKLIGVSAEIAQKLGINVPKSGVLDKWEAGVTTDADKDAARRNAIRGISPEDYFGTFGIEKSAAEQHEKTAYDVLKTKTSQLKFELPVDVDQIPADIKPQLESLGILKGGKLQLYPGYRVSDLHILKDLEGKSGDDVILYANSPVILQGVTYEPGPITRYIWGELIKSSKAGIIALGDLREAEAFLNQASISGIPTLRFKDLADEAVQALKTNPAFWQPGSQGARLASASPSYLEKLHEGVGDLLESGEPDLDPNWFRMALIASAFLDSGKKTLTRDEIIIAAEKKFSQYGVETSLAQITRLIDRLVALELIKKDGRDYSLNVSPELLAVKTRNSDFIQSQFEKVLDAFIADPSNAEGLRKLFSDYSQVTDLWPDFPVESYYPVLDAVTVMSKEKQDALNKFLLTLKGSDRSRLSARLLLMSDIIPDGWLEKFAPNLKGRTVINASPEISQVSGGLGPVMQYHSTAMKALAQAGANVITIEPRYTHRLQASGRKDENNLDINEPVPFNYADLPWPVTGMSAEPNYTFELTVNGQRVTAQVWKGKNKEGMDAYLIGDKEGRITKLLYRYDEYGTASREDFIEFFGKATKHLTVILETEKLKSVGADNYKGAVMIANDGQSAGVIGYMTPEDSDNSEEANLLRKIYRVEISHTYNNRQILPEGEKGAEKLRQSGLSRTHYANRGGYYDWTSLAIRMSHLNGKVSGPHKELDGIDPNNPAVAFTNGSYRAKSRAEFEKAVRMVDPSADIDNLSPEMVEKGKRQAILNATTDPVLLKLNPNIAKLDPNKVTFGYFGRNVSEKVDEANVWTRENVRAVAAAGGQIVLFANVQPGDRSRYESSYQMYMRLKKIEEEIDKEFPGAFVVVSGWGPTEKLKGLAMTHIQVMVSKRKTGAAEFTESDIFVNYGKQFAAPWIEGITQIAGKMENLTRPGSGNVIIPNGPKEQDYRTVFMREIKSFYSNKGDFFTTLAASSSLGRPLTHLNTGAAYLESISDMIGRFEDPISVVRAVLKGDTTAKKQFMNEWFRKTLEQYLKNHPEIATPITQTNNPYIKAYQLKIDGITRIVIIDIGSRDRRNVEEIATLVDQKLWRETLEDLDVPLSKEVVIVDAVEGINYRDYSAADLVNKGLPVILRDPGVQILQFDPFILKSTKIEGALEDLKIASRKTASAKRQEFRDNNVVIRDDKNLVSAFIAADIYQKSIYGIRAVVVFTKTGESAKRLSELGVPVIAVTSDDATYQQLEKALGIYPVLVGHEYEDAGSYRKYVEHLTYNLLQDQVVASSGKSWNVVVVYGRPGQSGADISQVINLKEIGRQGARLAEQDPSGPVMTQNIVDLVNTLIFNRATSPEETEGRLEIAENPSASKAWSFISGFSEGRRAVIYKFEVNAGWENMGPEDRKGLLNAIFSKTGLAPVNGIEMIKDRILEAEAVTQLPSIYGARLAKEENAQALGLNMAQVNDLTKKNAQIKYGATVVAGHPIAGEAGAVLKNWQDELLEITHGKFKINAGFSHSTVGALLGSQDDPIRLEDLSSIDFSKLLQAVEAARGYQIIFKKVYFGQDKQGNRDGNLVIESVVEGEGLSLLQKAFSEAGFAMKWSAQPLGTASIGFITLGHVSTDILEVLTAEEAQGLKQWVEAHAEIQEPVAVNVDEVKLVLYDRRTLDSTVMPDISFALGQKSSLQRDQLKQTIADAFEHRRRFENLKQQEWRGILTDVDYALTDKNREVSDEVITNIADKLRQKVRIGLTSSRAYEADNRYKKFDDTGKQISGARDLKEIVDRIRVALGNDASALNYLDVFPEDSSYGFNAGDPSVAYDFGFNAPIATPQGPFDQEISKTLSEYYRAKFNINYFDESSIIFKSRVVTVQIPRADQVSQDAVFMGSLEQQIRSFFSSRSIEVELTWSGDSIEIKPKGANKGLSVKKFDELLGGGLFVSLDDQGQVGGNGETLVNRPGGISLDRFNSEDPSGVAASLISGKKGFEAWLFAVNSLKFVPSSQGARLAEIRERVSVIENDLKTARTQNSAEWSAQAPKVFKDVEAFLETSEAVFAQAQSADDASASMPQLLQILRGIRLILTLPQMSLEANPESDRVSERVTDFWKKLGTWMEDSRVRQATDAVIRAGLDEDVEKKMGGSNVVFESGVARVQNLTDAYGPYSFSADVWAPWLTKETVVRLIRVLPVDLDTDFSIRIPEKMGDIDVQKVRGLIDPSIVDPIKRMEFYFKKGNDVRNSLDELDKVAVAIGLSKPVNLEEANALKAGIQKVIDFLVWYESWQSKKSRVLSEQLAWYRSIKDALGIPDAQMSLETFTVRLLLLNLPKTVVSAVAEGKMVPSEGFVEQGQVALEKGMVADIPAAGGIASRFRTSLAGYFDRGFISHDEIGEGARALEVTWEDDNTGVDLAIDHLVYLAEQGQNVAMPFILSPYTWRDFMRVAWKRVDGKAKRPDISVIIQNPGQGVLIEGGKLTRKEVPNRVLGHGNIRDFMPAVIDLLRDGRVFGIIHSADNPLSRPGASKLKEIVGRMSAEGIAHIAVGQARKIGQPGGGFTLQNGHPNVVDTAISSKEIDGYSAQRDMALFSLFLNVVNFAALLYAVDGPIQWEEVKAISQGDPAARAALTDRLEKLTPEETARLTDNFMQLLPSEFVAKKETDGSKVVQWEQVSGMLHGAMHKAIEDRMARDGRSAEWEDIKRNVVMAYEDSSMENFDALGGVGSGYEAPLFLEVKAAGDAFQQKPIAQKIVRSQRVGDSPLYPAVSAENQVSPEAVKPLEEKEAASDRTPMIPVEKAAEMQTDLSRIRDAYSAVEFGPSGNFEISNQAGRYFALLQDDLSQDFLAEVAAFIERYKDLKPVTESSGPSFAYSSGKEASFAFYNAMNQNRFKEAVQILTVNHVLFTPEQLLPMAQKIREQYQGPIAIVGKLGGSSIAFEASTPWGLLGYRISVPTSKPGDTEQDVVNRIAAAVAQVAGFYGSTSKVYSVYFSAPGSFDNEGKLSEAEPNIPALNRIGFSFEESVGKAVNLLFSQGDNARAKGLDPVKVTVVHDGTAAALGETSVYGSLRDDQGRLTTNDIFFVIAGTGVGTRRLINGQPYLGDARVRFLINEAPHGLLFNENPSAPGYTFYLHQTNGSPIYTDKFLADRVTLNPDYRGEDLEDRTSGPGIAQYAASEVQRVLSQPSGEEFAAAEAFFLAAGRNPANINTLLIGTQANAGNPFAIRILRERARELGIGIIATLLAYKDIFGVDAPRQIIIGSGVAQIGPLFLQYVKEGAASQLAVRPDLQFRTEQIALSRIQDDTAREFFGGLPAEQDFKTFEDKFSALAPQSSQPVSPAVVSPGVSSVSTVPAASQAVTPSFTPNQTLRAFGLSIRSTEATVLQGSGNAQAILNSPEAAAALRISTLQAVAAFPYTGIGLEGAENKAENEERKEAADANASYATDGVIRDYVEASFKSEKPAAVIVFGDEGGKDGSVSLGIGDVYYPDANGQVQRRSFGPKPTSGEDTRLADLKNFIRQLQKEVPGIAFKFYAGDGVENTSGLLKPKAAKEATSSATIAGFLNIDLDWFMSEAGYLSSDALRIQAIATRFDLTKSAGLTPYSVPSEVLTAIARELNTPLEEVVQNTAFFALKPRAVKKTTDSATSAHRNDKAFADAKALVDGKLEIRGAEDGNALPAIFAVINLPGAGKKLVMIDRIGGPEAFAIFTFAANHGLELLGQIVSAKNTNTELNPATAQNLTADEDAEVRPYGMIDSNTKPKPVVQVTGSVAVSVITGLEPSIYGNNIPDLFRRIEVNEADRSIAIFTLLSVPGGTDLLVKTTFSPNRDQDSIKDTLKALTFFKTEQQAANASPQAARLAENPVFEASLLDSLGQSETVRTAPSQARLVNARVQENTAQTNLEKDIERIARDLVVNLRPVITTAGSLEIPIRVGDEQVGVFTFRSDKDAAFIWTKVDLRNAKIASVDVIDNPTVFDTALNSKKFRFQLSSARSDEEADIRNEDVIKLFNISAPLANADATEAKVIDISVLDKKTDFVSTLSLLANGQLKNIFVRVDSKEQAESLGLPEERTLIADSHSKIKETLAAKGLVSYVLVTQNKGVALATDALKDPDAKNRVVLFDLKPASEASSALIVMSSYYAFDANDRYVIVADKIMTQEIKEFLRLNPLLPGRILITIGEALQNLARNLQAVQSAA